MERQDLIDQDELFYKLLCILSTVTETEFETLDDIQDLTFTVCSKVATNAECAYL